MSKYYRKQLVAASLSAALKRGCNPYDTHEAAGRELPKIEAMRGANRTRRMERAVARMLKRGEL